MKIRKHWTFGGSVHLREGRFGRKNGREFKGLRVGLTRRAACLPGRGHGLAERFVATPDGGVEHVSVLDADGYETSVASRDPLTGEARGRLRTDANAVRFVEFLVIGPKTWSLAAALHPDVAKAYDAPPGGSILGVAVIAYSLSELCGRASNKITRWPYQVTPFVDFEAREIAARMAVRARWRTLGSRKSTK